MLTVIKDGKFTGTRYTEDKQEYRDFHEEQGEFCIWYTGDITESTISNETLLNYYKDAKKVKLQSVKKELVNSGVIVNDVLFDTDSNARLSYMEFKNQLVDDPVFTVDKWKASVGQWVTMTEDLCNAVITAGKAQMTSIFDWQGAQESAIDDILLADYEDVDAAIDAVKSISTTYQGA
jgi:hypothetical protein